jgi:hypothetical protein
MVSKAFTVHTTRDGMQQYYFLGESPLYKQHIPMINQITQHLRQDEIDLRKAFGEERQVHPRFQQYNNIRDFVGLTWLMEQVLLRLGAINHLNVKMFEKLRILPNENPSQAYSRVRREAILIHMAEVGSFDKDIALHNLITSAQLPDGHTFLTKALYNHCRHIVQGQIIQNKIPRNAHEEITQLWISIADTIYFNEVGLGTPMDIDMRKELVDYGAWHEKFKKLRSNPAAAVNAGSSGDRATRQPDPSNGKYCVIHGKCTHSTDDCKELQGYLKDRKKDRKGDPVAVTTPTPGVNPVSIGARPNALYTTAGQGQLPPNPPSPNGPVGGNSLSVHDAPASQALPKCMALGNASWMGIPPSRTGGNQGTNGSLTKPTKYDAGGARPHSNFGHLLPKQQRLRRLPHNEQMCSHGMTRSWHPSSTLYHSLA